MIYLLTAIVLSPGGSSTVHIYTQTIHRTTQNKQYIEQHNNLGECGPCPVLASYTLAFVLQLRKKHGKTCMLIKSLSSYCRRNFDPNLINPYHHIDPWQPTAKFWLHPLRLGLINVTSYLHFQNKTNTCYHWHRHKSAVICNVIWLPVQILLDIYWI